MYIVESVKLLKQKQKKLKAYSYSVKAIELLHNTQVTVVLIVYYISNSMLYIKYTFKH